MVDDHVVAMSPQQFMVRGLAVHQGRAVVVSGVKLLEGGEGDAQELDHPLILGAGDGADGGNGAAGQAVPQEAFQGQGAGNGVRVGINQDHQPVFMAEKLVESWHEVAHVDKPLKLFYLRSCPGANEEAGFFQIMPEISEASEPRERLGVPDGQFLPMRRFFFAMPGPYIIN